MLLGSSRARVFIYEEPCDMRKSFSGLCGIVRSSLGGDPLSGHYYFFLNKRCNYTKILSWDGTGYCIWSKKLPQGLFNKPGLHECLLSELLSLLESGIGKKDKRYRHIAD